MARLGHKARNVANLNKNDVLLVGLPIRLDNMMNIINEIKDIVILHSEISTIFD